MKKKLTPKELEERRLENNRKDREYRNRPEFKAKDKAKRQKYRDEHREEIRAKSRENYKKNSEEIIEKRRNSPNIQKYQKEYMKAYNSKKWAEMKKKS